MSENSKLKIAIQKKGRLNEECLELFKQCGLIFRTAKNALFCQVENLPVDILFVRDDDIPTLIMDGACDLGIIGENVLLEKSLSAEISTRKFQLIQKLGFCKCRLAIALPSEKTSNSIENCKIATTYPNLLARYLTQNKINATPVHISGSVEITPRLHIADAICDLVSSGRTLKENNLKEIATVIESEAVLIQTHEVLSENKMAMISLLINRLQSVINAKGSKYIMFHVPKAVLETICKILPGCETPSIMPLEGNTLKVAVHVVSREAVFWTTLEKLRQMGATSILVLPIEKILN